MLQNFILLRAEQYTTACTCCIVLIHSCLDEHLDIVLPITLTNNSLGTWADKYLLHYLIFNIILGNYRSHNCKNSLLLLRRNKNDGVYIDEAISF